MTPARGLVIFLTFFFALQAPVWGQLKEGQNGLNLRLTDQYDQQIRYPLPDDMQNEDGSYPVTVLIVADKNGSADSEKWGMAIAGAFEADLARTTSPGLVILPVAHLAAVPGVARGMVKGFFVAPAGEPKMQPVGLDWEGSVAKQLKFEDGKANLYVLDKAGVLRFAHAGPLDKAGKDKVIGVLKPLLK